MRRDDAERRDAVRGARAAHPADRTPVYCALLFRRDNAQRPRAPLARRSKLIHEHTWKGRPLAHEAQDLNKMCEEWAKRGECDSNPGYMKENCVVSCSRRDKSEL